jgi:hypothetical protein
MKSTSSHASSLNAFPKTIKGRGIAWTPDLQQLLDLRLEKVTERFSPKIRSISASLEDVNGPRGGVDKKCRVTVMLASCDQVSVSACAPKAEAALTRAVGKAKAVLLRKLQGARNRTNERNFFQDNGRN